ncbi:MAG: MFS transporter [bacterium]
MSKKSPLLIAFMTVALDLLGFGIIIPIQPFYAEAFGATPTMVTWLGASYSLMQFLFVPFWGRLSDRIGRRPVILTSVALGTLGYVIFGLAGSLGMLFAARMLSGFGNANIATAQAIIADTTSGPERTKGMGLIGAAFGLGFIFGPALGGFLGQFGLAWPAFGAAALGVVNFVFAAVMLPETRPETRPDAVRVMPWEVLPKLLHHPNFGRIVSVIFVMTTGFALMEQALGLYVERVWVPEALTSTGDAQREALRQAAALTSYILVVVGVTAAIVQGGLIGRLSKQFGERRLALLGLSFVSLSMLLIPLVGSLGTYALMFPAAVLLATGTGLATPSLNSLLSQSVDGSEQGGALGVGQSASALGRVVGPAISGMLFQWIIIAPFVAGALLTALAVLVSVGIRITRPSQAPQH